MSCPPRCVHTMPQHLRQVRREVFAYLTRYTFVPLPKDVSKFVTVAGLKTLAAERTINLSRGHLSKDTLIRTLNDRAVQQYPLIYTDDPEDLKSAKRLAHMDADCKDSVTVSARSDAELLVAIALIADRPEEKEAVMLRFSNCTFNHTTTETLCSAMEGTPLKYLKFDRGCVLSCEGRPSSLDVFLNRHALMELSFDNCSILDVWWTALNRAMGRVSNMRSVSVTACLPDDVISLVRSMGNRRSSVGTFSVRDMEMGDRFAEELALALKENRSLGNLHLYNTDFTSRGVRVFLEGLGDAHELRRVYLTNGWHYRSRNAADLVGNMCLNRPWITYLTDFDLHPRIRQNLRDSNPLNAEGM